MILFLALGVHSRFFRLNDGVFFVWGLSCWVGFFFLSFFGNLYFEFSIINYLLYRSGVVRRVLPFLGVLFSLIIEFCLLGLFAGVEGLWWGSEIAGREVFGGGFLPWGFSFVAVSYRIVLIRLLGVFLGVWLGF